MKKEGNTAKLDVEGTIENERSLVELKDTLGINNIIKMDHLEYMDEDAHHKESRQSYLQQEKSKPSWYLYVGKSDDQLHTKKFKDAFQSAKKLRCQKAIAENINHLPEATTR